jgi:hypothetical protein
MSRPKFLKQNDKTVAAMFFIFITLSIVLVYELFQAVYG